MRTKALLTLALCLCVGGLLIACGGGTNVTVNAPAKNAAPAANTSSAPPVTDAKPADAKAADTGDSTGVPECDDYIKKYEACLTKIAKAAPQVEDQMKKSFETTRDAWKKAAANPTTKAGLAAGCKQATDAAKTATKAYACEF
jgi:hypothetical protein